MAHYEKQSMKELRDGRDNGIVIYQDDDEVTRISVRFADEDLWLTQAQLADIYCTTQQNIAQHISNIYNDKELEEATHKKFLLVRKEGNRDVQRNIEHYNLDMVIALGYRVQSQVATRFRRWATQRLHEYIRRATLTKRSSNYRKTTTCRPEEKDVMVGVAEVERRASSLALPRWSNVVEDKVVVNLKTRITNKI